MYQYKHGKLDRNGFETLYRAYMTVNGYKFEEYDVAAEWRYYDQGRSWFAAWLDAKMFG